MSRRPPRRALALAILLALVVLALLAGPEALARVGGGHGYSGGGSSGGGWSGGGWSGGGGGGGGGDLTWLVIWLLMEHPAIGVPVAVAALIYVAWKGATGRDAERTWRSPPSLPSPSPAPRRVRRRAPRVDLAGLRARDPNFSEPLFLDFVQLVYARAHEMRGAGRAEPLRPTLSERALSTLMADRDGLEAVRDVVFGATRIVGVHLGPRWSQLEVRFETNLTEVRGGRERQLLRKERWTFRRRSHVLSPGPEGMRTLGCPACGSTAEPRADGTCPSCDAPRTGGQLQWEASRIAVVSSRVLDRVELHLGGGVEPGTRLPTVVDPDLPVRRRALAARDPDWSWEDFRTRVERVFLVLQEAWSTRRWELARPHETDALFQVHRFWMERYRREGLVNRIADVHVLGVELARIDLDAFVESVTVRVHARALDWTERAGTGEVVGGSRTEPREFTEYWTFIRSAGTRTGARRDPGSCPSCGAPLDRVNMAGVCGYCDAKITSGDFDWVLSRIEQDEAYAG